MKTQNPIIGRAKGSAGGMTFCKVYDKNVARAKAFEVSNPNTEAQQTQRNFFKELTALTTDFSDAQLRTLFPAKPKTMSRRNALTKQIAESYEVEGTEKNIDFTDIDTLGNAPVMDFGTTTFTVSNGTATVALDQSVKNNQALADNDFIAALVNETKGEIYIGTNTAIVSVGKFVSAVPSTWSLEDTIHAIPLILESKNGAFATKGFGTLGVVNRPARKGRNPHTGQ